MGLTFGINSVASRKAFYMIDKIYHDETIKWYNEQLAKRRDAGENIQEIINDLDREYFHSKTLSELYPNGQTLTPTIEPDVPLEERGFGTNKEPSS